MSSRIALKHSAVLHWSRAFLKNRDLADTAMPGERLANASERMPSTTTRRTPNIHVPNRARMHQANSHAIADVNARTMVGKKIG
jgi:hypothetical protein